MAPRTPQRLPQRSAAVTRKSDASRMAQPAVAPSKADIAKRAKVKKRKKK